jgi:hypothetical protein
MTKQDEDRAKRLAEALRANLRKRKAQARAVTSAEPTHRDDDPERDRHDNSER